MISVDFSTTTSFSWLSRLDWRVFRSNQLQLVGDDLQQRGPQESMRVLNADAPPQDNSLLHSAGHSPRSRFQKHWQGLSSRSKIGWAVAAGIAFLINVGIVNGSNAHDQAHSPSYQMGYDAAGSQQGGYKPKGLSDDQISQYCSGLLEFRVRGAQAKTNTELPSDFSSQDFLTGCTDASQAFK
jgi:hypothetical protein